MKRILLACAAIGCAVPAHSAVRSVGASGFQIRNSARIAASPDKVWATLVEPARWWSSRHSWSGDAKNLSLELKPGGCWCERWSGGFARHLEVVYAEPSKELGLWGALGPLRRDGFAGGLVITLAPDGAGTLVTQTYTVGGYSPTSLAEYAAAVDQVWTIQLPRLKAIAEDRKPSD